MAACKKGFKKQLSRRREKMGGDWKERGSPQFLLGVRKAVLPAGRGEITCSPSESVSSIWKEPRPTAGVSLQSPARPRQVFYLRKPAGCPVLGTKKQIKKS